jgi:hypothetical protein
MLIGQDPKLLAGESLVVAMIWVIPSWLVFRAWRRYQCLDSVQSSLRIAMSGLLISEAMLLLVGVVVAVEMTSSARMLSSPQALGAVNLFLCLIALVGPFGAKNSRYCSRTESHHDCEYVSSISLVLCNVGPLVFIRPVWWKYGDRRDGPQSLGSKIR